MKSITLDLTNIAHGGEAFGRYEGKIVFVPYALPGERVRARIVDEHKRWARAGLLDVLSPSEDRIEPACPYFGPEKCGGCQWQHIRYERQLTLKREIVVDQLRRLGHLADPPVLPTRPVGEPFGYRNHVQLAVGDDGQLGYRRAGSHEIVPVDRCLLLHPLLGELLDALQLGDEEDAPSEWGGWLRRVTLRAGVTTGQRLVVFEARGEEPPALEVTIPTSCALLARGGKVQPLIGPPYVEEVVADRVYRVSAGSFFQVNTPGADVLVDLVRRYLEPAPDDTLLDAYCGVGLFGLALLGDVGRLIGVEVSSLACDDFAWNARQESPERVVLYEGPVEDVLSVLDDRVDLAIVDPPRSGVGQRAIAELARLGPRRIVYVSCDPATLARDVAYLQAVGYRLQEVQPVDLFPQTFHIETVSLWVREV
ncbi:MAG: 23S rRNA (uracil(1939)-C(5))-methyltransferase RlmD [Anaerolineae bacterium]|nr:23S rRNA (uracil(1939)-C(5))-methyltransferase RlmD [Anaerolineae bacterium]